MSILIVDDNARMRETIRAILQPLDDELHECENGDAALALYPSIKPSWVLMDITMAGLDGLGATRAIRALDPAARIVIVTQHPDPVLRQAAEEAGAAGYVLKEDLSALVRMIAPDASLARALHASEARYRSLFENVPVGLYRTAPDGRLIDGNAALAQMLGYSRREALLQTTIGDHYVDPQDRRRWDTQMAGRGVVRDFEVRIRRHDGMLLWTRDNARCVLDDHGDVLYHEGALQDITERRRAEEALRYSEARYRVLYEQNPSMYFTLSPDGAVRSVNRFGAAQLGYTPEELLGRRVLEIFHPDDRKAVTEALTLCLASPDELFSWEYRKVRKDGSVLWVKESARAVEAPNGDTTVFIVCEDITEHRQAQQALRDSEERYRALYDDTPSMYFTVDATGTVLSVNQYGAAHLGYTPAELEGGPVSRVFHSSDRAAAHDRLAEAIAAGGRAHAWELRKQRLDGSILWVRETARAVRGRDGAPVVLIVCEDITQAKEAEEAVRRSETMAAMGALIAAVAHEVRNPLQGIAITVDDLAGSADVGARHREEVAALGEHLGRLQRLMQDLLDFGRPPDIRLAPTRLGGVLSASAAACERLATGRGVAIEVTVAPGLPELLLDAGRVEQVFTNLIDNAVRHTPEHSMVSVDAHRTDDPAWITCVVSDRGEGIRPEDRPRVVEPFFSKRPGGTGLGLAIVRRIVEQHAGSVWADAVPSGGTAIHVLLPVTGRDRPPG